MGNTMGHPMGDTIGWGASHGEHHGGHSMVDPMGQRGIRWWTPWDIGAGVHAVEVLRGREACRGAPWGAVGLTGILEELHVHLNEGEALAEAVGHQDLLLLEDLRHLPGPPGHRGPTHVEDPLTPHG